MRVVFLVLLGFVVRGRDGRGRNVCARVVWDYWAVLACLLGTILIRTGIGGLGAGSFFFYLLSFFYPASEPDGILLSFISLFFLSFRQRQAEMGREAEAVRRIPPHVLDLFVHP